MIPGRTGTERDESSLAWRMRDGLSRADLAAERGYEPHPDDRLPAPQWAAEQFGGDGFEREIRAARFVGALTRCTHPHCRTSLTEETVTYCPHDRPFCEMCVWEDGCQDCWDLAIDAAKDGAA